MPGQFTVAGKNAMLAKASAQPGAAASTEITLASVHTAFPPTNVNEIAATNGARQAITWNAPAAAAVDNNANPGFDVAAGTTVGAIAYRSSDGTILAEENVPDEVFTNAGRFDVTDADLSLTDLP